MRKSILMAASALMTVALTFPAFAAWQSDASGWWWQNDDGSWPANTWQWIDGDQDGTAESYYFGADGYLLTDTTTPDGYTVNADGAWVENGVVQTQAQAPAQEQAQTGGKYDGEYKLFYDYSSNRPYDYPSTAIITTQPDGKILLSYDSGQQRLMTYTEEGTSIKGTPTYIYEKDENNPDDFDYWITFLTDDIFRDLGGWGYTRVK